MKFFTRPGDLPDIKILNTDRFARFFSLEKNALIHIRSDEALPDWGAPARVQDYGRLSFAEYPAGYALTLAGSKPCRIRCSRDFARVYLPASYGERFDPACELLLNAFRSRLIVSGSLCAHGAAVVCRERAVLFCGLSTAGKSTQAQLWRDYLGAWVLNYDKPALLHRDGQRMAAGTPWSGKEPCYIPRTQPLEAIFFVEKHSSNECIRLSPAEAFSHLYPNYMPMPVSNEISEGYRLLVEDWANHVPCYTLRCTISEEAVQLAYAQVFGGDYIKTKQEFLGGFRMRRNNQFIIRNIADDYVILPRGELAIHFDKTLITNELGAFIWKRLANETTIGELVTDVLTEYDVDEATARQDISEFVEQLRREGILESESIGE